MLVVTYKELDIFSLFLIFRDFWEESAVYNVFVL